MALSLRSPRGAFALVVTAGAAAFAACGTEDSVFGPGTSSGSGTSGSPTGDFGSSGNTGDAQNAITVSALVFDPPVQRVTADGVNPVSVNYKLRATLPSGQVIDVTPEALQFDRPDLAAATNGSPVTLTTTGAYGGKGTLHGIYGGVEAVAELEVKVARKDVTNGVPAAAVTALDAPNLSQDQQLSTLRYPYDKTVFPLGLTPPLVMWNRPAPNDVYRLRLEEANYTYDLYAVVTGLGQLRVEQGVWDRVTASNGGSTDPLKVTLSRYSITQSTAYVSATESWTIAPASLRGAIYYWTASLLNGVSQGHIARIRPGSGSAPEAMSTGQSNPCMGCHAVSADGSTLAASVDAAPTGDRAVYRFTNGHVAGRGWASFNLPDGTVRKQTKMNGSNLALTPDGKYTVFGGRNQTDAEVGQNVWEPGSKYMTLADTATGTIVPNSGLDDVVLDGATRSIGMPAFSPDGKKLAVVEHMGEDKRDNVLLTSTGILILGFDQATLKFTPTPTRLPVVSYGPYPTSGIGYPSFTPSSTHVAFHVGNRSTGCFSDAFGSCDDNVQHRGALWYQPVDGTSAPVRLGHLNDPPAAADLEQNVEPTFNPVERGGYSWVVFTSMRDWGNKLTGTANNGKRRLWVAAIDTSGATDPSHPPFYLEGQEDSPNMRGFWTLAPCTPTPAPGAQGGKCTANFECCSGFCDKGVCVEPSAIKCVGLGGDCTTAADCCNAQSVSCVGNKCSVNEVR